jgi:hypothetical protein
MDVVGGREVASEELRARVRALVDRLGIVRAARILKLSRQTVSAVIAGLAVQRGTIFQATALCPPDAPQARAGGTR